MNITSHLPHFQFSEKNTNVLNIFVISSLMMIYGLTVGLNLWLVMIAVVGAAVMIVSQLLLQNIKDSSAHAFAITSMLTGLSCIVSNATHVSALLLVIPIYIYCTNFPHRLVFAVPVIGSIGAEYFLVAEWNLTTALISLSALLLCLKINQTLGLLRQALEEQDFRLQQFEQLQTSHTSFLKRLTAGDYQDKNEFQDNDMLGNLLHEFGLKIQSATEQDQRKSWQMHGLNELNTILRSSTSLEGRYDVLISFLVKYISANQGGFFIINEEENLELKACYAYEKQRILNKQIPIGQSMLGQCVLENETLYVEQIPVNYVHITSGLGLATPSSLVMVPVKYNNKVLGVVELASFKKMERYQLEFLERASEIIGGALLSFQSNALTKRMLEESQQLSEELKAQQEEVRQNLEELEATQEHLMREGKEREKLQDELRKSKEFLNLIIDSVPVPVFVKDRKHQMVLVNKAVCDLNALNRDEMIGKSDYDFFPKEQADVFWNVEEEIFKSKSVVEKMQRVTRHGKETMSIDKKLVIETQDGECFLVGINIDVTNDSTQQQGHNNLITRSA